MLINYTTTDQNIITIQYNVLNVVSNIYDSNVGTLILGKPIERLEDYAFYRLDNLLSLTLPDGITEMESRLAINDCSSLESIKFGNGLTTIKGVGSCPNLKEIIFSPNNREIADYAFSYTQGFTELTIPDNIETIGSWAFNHCQNLQTVTIGTGLHTLMDNAFCYCNNLQSVYINAINPPSITQDSWGTWDAFYGCNNLNIYVPEESLDAYRSADGWSNYADIIVGHDFNE